MHSSHLEPDVEPIIYSTFPPACLGPYTKQISKQLYSKVHSLEITLFIASDINFKFLVLCFLLDEEKETSA